jgi:predicted nucleic acid-binding protein
MSAGRKRIGLEARAANLFADLNCEPIPVLAAERYARLKASQQRLGLPLDENDLWIAATALAIGATLVTRDTDFQSIQGLPLLNP